jgi:VWFA-related protein
MNRGSMRWFAIALIFCFLFSNFAIGNAQTPGISVRIDRIDSKQFPVVEVWASVSSAQNMPVANLTKTNFTLAEDGKPLTEFDISPLQSTDIASTYVFAIDTSAGMAKTQYGFPLKDAVEAIKTWQKSLGAKEQVGLISFASKTADLVKPTDDRGAIERELDKLNATGYTALYDGIVQGVEMLKNRSERRVLIVVTDSFDYGASIYKYNDALKEATTWGVPIMTVGFGANVDKATLDKLATLTGGSATITSDSSQLKDTFTSILHTLRYQYKIRFSSNLQADAKDHDLTVGANFQSTSAESKIRFLATTQEVKVELPGYTDGQEAGGPLKFSPQAVSPIPPIVKMELLVDGQAAANNPAAPFDLAWDASKIQPGMHELVFKATDSANNIGQFKIQLKIRPPVIVSLANPVAGSSVNGNVTLKSQVNALAGLMKVEYLLDGTSLHTVTSAPYEFAWDTSKNTPGNHTLSVNVTDANGFTASSAPVAFQITLQNDLGLGFIVVLVALAAIMLIIPLALRSRRKMRPAAASAAPASSALNDAPMPLTADQPLTAPLSGGQAVLVQTDAAAPGYVWPLNLEEVRLGRKRDENDIPLASSQASRRHAVIRQHAGSYIVYSLSPENPALVNGVAVQQQTLSPGDELQLGEHTFRFEFRE